MIEEWLHGEQVIDPELLQNNGEWQESTLLSQKVKELGAKQMQTLQKKFEEKVL